MLTALLCHVCRHDEINKEFYLKLKNKRTTQSDIPQSEKWRPIRIKVNYDFVEGKLRNERSCYDVGQIITINNQSYKCQKKDILTKEQINAIKVTNDNVIKYLQNTLKVQSLLEPIKVNYMINFGEFPEMKFPDTDFALVATSYVHEDGSSEIAAAGSRDFIDSTFRPILGMVRFNPAFVPSTPSNLTDYDNNFFSTVLHELTHALGFMYPLFEHYHPINSTTPYGNNALCSFTKYGRKFTFLVTPYCHLFAKKRFGVETFYGDNGAKCPSGIELEDQGSSSTAGSHLEKRVYNSEIMVGDDTLTKIPFFRYSDATLSILMDTGFYQINWANAQPLVFGHPESIDGKPIEGFAIDPPQKSFPEKYLFDLTNDVGFDYRSITAYYNKLILEEYIDCSNPFFQLYCGEARYAFYNPVKSPVISSDILADYQLTIYPELYCWNNTANLPGRLTDVPQYTNAGDLKIDDICGTYKCNNYESFDFTIKDADGKTITKTCSKKNINEEFNHTLKAHYNNTEYIITKTNYCPDPERFCRTMKLSYMNFNKDPFDPNTKVLEGDPQTPPEWTFDYSDLDKELKAKKKKLAIALGVTCGISVIVVVSIVLCCYFKKKKTQPYQQQSDQVEEDMVNNP